LLLAPPQNLANTGLSRQTASMGTLKLASRTVQYQWASDVNVDGIRLEVLSDDGNILFDVSVPDDGPISVSTFGMRLPET
jgi:hypothetical protein